MKAAPKPAPWQYHENYPHDTGSVSAFLNHSLSKTRADRQRDTRLIAEGKPPIGPVWSYTPSGKPVCIHRDLISYFRANYIRSVPIQGSASPAKPPVNTDDTPPTAA